MNKAPEISLSVPASGDGPRIARNAVLARLDGSVTDQTAHDIALLISELVTNSVVHSDLRTEDTVLVELAVVDDRLTITVSDHGSDLLPHLLPWDPTTPHGLGLHLVDAISANWGVRNSAGATQVWCELALGESHLPRPSSQAASAALI
jgi:anti-sigma regulatory factor (Ser/Thr protein kinase)